MKRFRTVVTAAALTMGMIGHASAATLEVANNGTDSVSCGAAATPCRTISRAIANAAAGDTIEVGPGMYGDLNHDATLDSGAGDEDSGGGPEMIVVNKTLKIISTEGAAVTVINNLNCGSLATTLVSIEANGVKFGARKKGFTIQDGGCGGFTGLAVNGGTSDVEVAGNTFKVYATAAALDGTGHTVKNNIIVGWPGVPSAIILGGNAHIVKGNIGENGTLATAAGSTGIVLKANQMLSIWGGHGFDLLGSGHVLKGNTASGASGSVGFWCHVDCGNTAGLTFSANVARGVLSSGFQLDSGTGHVLASNVASGLSGSGFYFTAPMTVTMKKNEANGNYYQGLYIASPGVVPTITKNAFIGNGSFGIYSNTTAGSISMNDIYGNDQTTPNCGISLGAAGTLSAQNNYWGAASGPGADPADIACPGSGTIDTSAPSAVPFH